MMDKENKLILYKDDEGRVSVNTRFADEDVWLTQEQLATIYQTTQENVSMHISNIYEDKELEKEGTYKKFLLFFATVQNKTMVSTNRLQLCRA